MLTDQQRLFIKKNYRTKKIPEISEHLKVPFREVEEYLLKKLGPIKFHNLHLSNPSISSNPPSKEKFLIPGFLAALIFAVYFNILDNQFLSDDLAEIVNNPNITSFSFVISHYYGFIRIFINFLIANLFGLDLTAFHLPNILFHVGSSYLVYLISLKLTNKKTLAFVTSLLFSVHPMISEAVTWISGGLYPQYSFFLLLSFLAYLKNRLTFSVLAFFMSLESHAVMSYAYVPLLISYEFLLGSIKHSFKKLIPFIFLTALSVAFTLFTLPEREATLQTKHYQERGMDNPFVLVPAAISSYLEMTAYPKNLTIYHSELAFSQLEFGVRSLVTILFLSAIAYTFFKYRLLCFFLCWFLITLSPTLTPFRMNWIVAERYSYLPSIGLFLVTGFFIDNLINKKSYREIAIVLTAIILIAFSVRTIIRNNDWQDADTLWLSAETSSPSSPNNHNNLGDLYGRRGDLKRAEAEFKYAIELKPNYADAYHNLGNTYTQMGNLEAAMQSYLKALEFSPGLWQSYQNIASIYFSQNDFDKAEQYLSDGLKISPNNPVLLTNLGVVSLKKDDKVKAQEYFHFALIINPNNEIAKNGLIEAKK